MNQKSGGQQGARGSDCAQSNGFLSWNQLLVVCSALALPILIPFIQFGIIYKIWEEYAEKVNKDSCSNSCWDTVFKGGYERGAGIYKHIYFNVTLQTFMIWSSTVVCIIALYESIKYLINLALCNQLRYRMLIVYLSSIYPHYYAWWSNFNYFNDDFYSQFSHQMLFTITELASTLMVLHLANSNIKATPAKLLVVVTIAASHVFVSCWDQFISNVLLREGFLHQVMRDVGFMLPDIIHIVLPVQEMVTIARKRGINNPAYLITNKMAISVPLYIAAFWCILLFM